MVATPALLSRNNPPKRAAGDSYEEYHPYGTTAWQAPGLVGVSLKRYRFTGMERDEETGLQRHGVRYYAAWLGRWTSADPIGLGGGCNRYAYCDACPVVAWDTTGMIPAADDPGRFNPPAYETTELDADTCTPNADLLDADGQVVRHLSERPDPGFSDDAKRKSDLAFRSARADAQVGCIDMVRILVGAVLEIDVPQRQSAASPTVLGSPTSDRLVQTSSGKWVDANDTVAGLANRLDQAGFIGDSASFVPTSKTGAKLTTSDALYFKQVRTPAARFDSSPGAAMQRMSGGKEGHFLFLVSLVSGTHSGTVSLDAANGEHEFTYRDQDIERRFTSPADLDRFLAEKSTWTSQFARREGANYPSTLDIHLLLPRPAWQQ